MLPDKAKFVVCSIISLALSFWMKHLVIGQLQKPAKFSVHGPSMLPDKAKFVMCSIISLALSFWMKHLVIGQLQKPAYKNLQNSRLFIGQHLEVRLSLISFREPAG